LRWLYSFQQIHTVSLRDSGYITIRLMYQLHLVIIIRGIIIIMLIITPGIIITVIITPTGIIMKDGTDMKDMKGMTEGITEAGAGTKDKDVLYNI
jgi:hypothetical protein